MAADAEALKWTATLLIARSYMPGSSMPQYGSFRRLILPDGERT